MFVNECLTINKYSWTEEGRRQLFDLNEAFQTFGSCKYLSVIANIRDQHKVSCLSLPYGFADRINLVLKTFPQYAEYLSALYPPETNIITNAHFFLHNMTYQHKHYQLSFLYN